MISYPKKIKKIIDDLLTSDLSHPTKLAKLREIEQGEYAKKNYSQAWLFNATRHDLILSQTKVCGIDYNNDENCHWWDYEHHHCLLLNESKPAYTPRCKYTDFRFTPRDKLMAFYLSLTQTVKEEKKDEN